MILIIIGLILLLLFYYYNFEGMQSIKHYVSFLDNEKSYLVNEKSYSKNENIEITTLPTCVKKLEIDYTTNYSRLINNGHNISQYIVDPLLQTAIIDGRLFYFVKLEFRKSRLTWNGKQVGLELHIIHNDYVNTPNLHFVIPLDLVESKKVIEGFKNVLYNKMEVDKLNDKLVDFLEVKDDISKNFKLSGYNIKFKKEVTELKNKFNLMLSYKKQYDMNIVSLNNLINNNIPEYECCVETIGDYININFCHLQKIISNMSQFYTLEEQTSNVLLITEPVPFDEDLGLLIRSNIELDESIVYIKPLKN
jgi:hypothetical protein